MINRKHFALTNRSLFKWSRVSPFSMPTQWSHQDPSLGPIQVINCLDISQLCVWLRTLTEHKDSIVEVKQNQQASPSVQLMFLWVSGGGSGAACFTQGETRLWFWFELGENAENDKYCVPCLWLTAHSGSHMCTGLCRAIQYICWESQKQYQTNRVH